jgi:branched-chain amino acid transport system substrate-binding protein
LDLVRPKNVYIVSQDTDWGRDTVNSFSRFIGNIKTVTDYVPSGTTDFSTILVKIQSLKPEVIYAILTGSEMYSFAEQRYSLGISSVLFGAGSTAASDIYIKTIGKDKANKTVVNLVWVPIGEKAEALASRYKKIYGSSPADLEAQNYDAVTLLLDGLRKAKSPAKADVAGGLLKAEIDGLRGHQKFREEDHTIPGLAFVIGQIQDGKYVTVWPASLAQGKLLK